MDYNLEKQVDEYSEELFLDLGLAAVPEEEKAEIYARLQEHLHKVILDTLRPALKRQDTAGLERALEEENYHRLDKILKRHPGNKELLEKNLDRAFQNLKLIMTEEQKNAGKTSQPKTPA